MDSIVRKQFYPTPKSLSIRRGAKWSGSAGLLTSVPVTDENLITVLEITSPCIISNLSLHSASFTQDVAGYISLKVTANDVVLIDVTAAEKKAHLAQNSGVEIIGFTPLLYGSSSSGGVGSAVPTPLQFDNLKVELSSTNGPVQVFGTVVMI